MNSDNNKPLPMTPQRYRTSKSFATFLDGMTLGVVGILIVVIGMLYVTQISVNTEISLLQLGLESGILYGATVSIYLLLRSFAKRKGIATDAWGNAYAAVERNNNWIVSQGIADKATEYCRSWEDDELNSSRERILADAGITLAEFNEKYLKYSVKEIKKIYCFKKPAEVPILAEHPPNEEPVPEAPPEGDGDKPKVESLSKFQFKTICRAKRTKRLHFNEDYLSVNNKYGKRMAPSQRITTKAMDRLKVGQILITTALTSVLGVSMALQLATDFSFATVVMCLVKIIIVLVFGTVGMVGGYNLTAVHAVEEMNIKVDEQNRFIKWCGADLPPKETAEAIE